MIQRTILSKGKRLLVNVPGGEDEGIGAGFPVGKLLLKNYADRFWYVVSAAGAPGSVILRVESTASAFGTSSYYDLNYPYQLLGSTNTCSYQVYLTGSSVIVSQSVFASSSYITNSYGTIYDVAKPNLMMYNTTDGNYYKVSLITTAGITTMSVNQNMISASWIDNTAFSWWTP